ncbi:MAG: hypothetical protein HKM02_12395 [Pseudomonadales bacterium]|nr:hypothetical protein [Pseudomonadales bacterium]
MTYPMENWSQRLILPAAILSVTVLAMTVVHLGLRLSHHLNPRHELLAMVRPVAHDDHDLQDLLALHWFGQSHAVQGAGNQVETALPLVLRGVFLSLGADSSSAMVQAVGQVQPRMYHTGDDVGGGTVVAVGERMIQIRRSDGHLEVLRISKDPALILPSRPDKQ